MNKILNLTQHMGTVDQTTAGVYEPSNKEEVQNLLTFETPPTGSLVRDRAVALAAIAQKEGAMTAMIGGAPFLMSSLEEELAKVGIAALYAFTRRETVEVDDGQGGVRKTAVFKHAGWVFGNA